MGNKGKQAGYCATVFILTSCVLSVLSLVIWVGAHPPQDAHHHDDHHGEEHVGDEGHPPAEKHETPSDGHASVDAPFHTLPVADAEGETDSESAESEAESHEGHGDGDHGDGHAEVPSYHGEFYTLGQFGKSKMSIGYYIDALTVCMFAMVTLIASCIHFYAIGYMHDELEGDDYVDHEVTMANGSHLHRPGRFHRFFQALSLFCFSMLGLVLAGNIVMTFVFWELVGICSYFLIGFYVERKSASTAANKAFIVNRVGDFGMIIGLMALWASLGTFQFGGSDGLFELVRPTANGNALVVPDGMVVASAREEVGKVVISLGPGATDEQMHAAVNERIPEWRDPEASGKKGGHGRWLLVVAGVGIFCGCVGKSAQFPLHVWLPDAMEGPTPVSALVHSATMVAAGVFLVGRFYPVFCPEVLFVIAITGTITLFMAATIAITATDIKRVLAYSTVSQLGYMMLSLGIGGWLAGMMHLFTHAFFKSLLFMCSGSVIHAVHTNEMTEMGGLRKKMPWTAYTMLIGCMAIAGTGLPFAIPIGENSFNLGFSGYYSKDAIIEQAWSFWLANSAWGMFFLAAAAGGASITAFYMFRMWYMTFAGPPKNEHRFDHAHESPPIMYRPLILLSVFAVAVAWRPVEGMIGAIVAALIFIALYAKSGGTMGEDDHHHSKSAKSPLFVALTISVAVFVIALCWQPIAGDTTLSNLLSQARPAGTLPTESAVLFTMTWPSEPISHLDHIKPKAGLLAFLTALAGFSLATVFYGLRKLDAEEARSAFAPIHRFLVNKWWFDELYQTIFVRPAHLIAGLISGFDRRCIDWVLDSLARLTRAIAVIWERFADGQVVDGFVNGLASRTYRAGLSLRGVQTGRLRQYVMFIAAGTVAAFVVASFLWNYAFAG
ncbi:MAG: NADH-quinone oxidoreductase subunit L [Planctomycetales bacterium]|nr:NADH-quinone oxidoreductase subunit L [Planctomycetales bacterium]